MRAAKLSSTWVDAEIEYPSSDGQPMAENTLQFEWIVTIKENLDAAIPDFVAGDLLWYPIEGDPTTRQAPDAMVALGRPKGHRSSYRQWREGGVAPQVVFEVLSPGNTLPEMERKRRFYERFGVQEYYIYDPDDRVLQGYLRQGERLVELTQLDGHVSPLLGVRFQLGEELEIYRPDGGRFLSFAELMAKADAAQARADAAQARAEALAAKLRELGIDPDKV